MDHYQLKKEVLIRLLDSYQQDLSLLERAAHEAREAATHEESKAENKYDTRGLEASYLAGAQAKRAVELQGVIRHLQNLEIGKFGPEDPVAPTALVGAEWASQPCYFFLIPKGVGKTIQTKNGEVQVLTTASPLGREFVGKHIGDEVTLKNDSASKKYTILGVY